MKIEKMDTNRIKVVLTSEDLDTLDVSIEHLTPESAELHSFLFRIMEQVTIETGFNPYNGQVIVEAKPSTDGITLLVTKIEKNITSPKSRQKIKNVRAKKKTAKTRIYKFNEFTALCGAISLITEDILLTSQLYKMDNIYYLAIHTLLPSEKYHAAISEFCDEYLFPDMYANVLTEHGELIAKHHALVNMADEIKKLY